MSLLPILKWPDTCLSAPCEKVRAVTPGIRQLAQDMLTTMYDAPGRGLAAPQVGHLLRLFVMDAGWKEGPPNPIVMINPKIVQASGEMVAMDEMCLSVPGIAARVNRPAGATFHWSDPDGATHTETLNGASARIAQHELDHLDGVITFNRVSPAARAALERDYAA